jgi:SAM-dependent methyltransferase
MIRCPRCAALYSSSGGARCSACRWTPATVDGVVAWAPELAEGGTGLADRTFALIAEHEDRHFWFQARNQRIVWALRRHFPALRTFLEIGCGTGVVLAAVQAAFPDASLTGTELATSGLGFTARRVPGTRVEQMDGRNVPYEGEFDVIGAFDVLEHIEDDRGVLAQMRRAVAPGGGAIVSVPQHQWLWSGVDDYSRHFRRYSRRELVGKLEAAGFTVEYVTSFMTFVLPAMALSRLMTPDAESLDPGAELKVGRITNAVCASLCRGEARLIARGWSLPLGGSLLAVARKVE